jgi:hypothetical protein
MGGGMKGGSSGSTSNTDAQLRAKMAVTNHATATTVLLHIALATAVFVGYVVAGWWGGILAAVAIFAPSVAMTIVAAEIYPYLRGLAAIRGAITGIMAAFVGLLATVVVSLGHQIVDVPAALSSPRAPWRQYGS